ncbi:hypothetical protein [Curtobacterium sp. MCBD17_032]|uniref:hypothetical protein n=1 Tax=Curtobacterium sp. MCBD17_032 TaxID=2175659 RepID=UPI000DAA1F04|nr:hypothetical protein [Curtobacterium sp. MCBD17_032]PZE86445.1 hypothetical protein DEI91_05005 [Curtobacterium sp. MCBD17_032]
MHITTRAAKTGTLVLVVAGLGGAVLHGLPEPVDHPVRPTTTKDVSAWTMPLDGWVVPGGHEQDYAEMLVDLPCLREAGLDVPPLPWATVAGLHAHDDTVDAAARANPSPALSTSRPLSAELASARGYHGPSTDGANVGGWREWGYAPGFDEAFAALPAGVRDRCPERTRRSLGTGASGEVQSASETAQRLTHLAALSARQDPAVTIAAAAWRTCMAPLGLADLPEGPEGMPTPSMRVTARDAEEVVTLSDEVGDDEIAVADRDVRCQRSSGYRQTLYDAEWDRLLRVTASDAAVLAAGDPGQRAVAARLDRVVEQHAPAAPADLG